MKTIRIQITTILLTALLSVTASASDWYQQQINELQSGIHRLYQQIHQEQADIDARYRNMKEVTLEEALGQRTGAAEKRRHNAELERANQAAKERVYRYQGQIADNERAIEKYRMEQRRAQEKTRRESLRLNW